MTSKSGHRTFDGVDPEMIRLIRLVCKDGSDDDVANFLGISGVTATMTALAFSLPVDAGRQFVAVLRQDHPEWFEGAS
jgi:hypothetical protein